MFASLFVIALLANADPALELAESLATRAEMHERFTRATMIQTALINGDLAAAQHWAKQLAMISPEAEDFGDLRARFGDLARAVARADSLPAAARRTANLANACGACHELHDVRSTRFESQLDVPPGESLQSRMARHIWAADRLWEGLVGRSDGSWSDGAMVLMEAPLTPEALAIQDPGAAVLAGQVNTLGQEAMDRARWSRRADVYGRFLGTCATCHAAFRARD